MDETNYGAQAQADFIVDVLEALNRNKNCILFIVGDNTNTNPATANLLGVPFIGCASHRFNLAVQEYLLIYEDILCDINELMKKLSCHKMAGKLRQKIHLESVTRNKTRWSSTYEMITRFYRLKDAIIDLKDDSLSECTPDGRDLLKLDKILGHLQEFQEVTKELQKENITMADVRLIFDEVCAQYPSMSDQLSKDAYIVKFKDFENAVVKVLSGYSNLLTHSEKACLDPFVVLEDEVVVVSEGDSLVCRALKRKKVETGVYHDLSYIPPTSNVVERCFSMARYIETSRN